MSDPEAAGDALTIPTEELLEVIARVAMFCDDDEGWPLGHLQLTHFRGRRRWVGGDGSVFVALDTSALGEGEAVEALLSPRLLPHPRLLGELAIGSATLTLPPLDLADQRTGPVRLAIADISVIQPAGVGVFPDVSELLTPDRHAVAVLNAVSLQAVVEQIRTVPAGLELGPDYPPPLAWLIAEPGRVGLRVDWPGVGRAEAFVDASVDGAARVTVPLGTVEQLLRSAPHDRVTVYLPTGDARWMILSQPGWQAVVHRFRPYASAEELGEQVRQWLEDDFGLGSVVPDDDGDLPLRFEDQRLYARVADGEPPVVQVFAVLGDGEEDDGLLLATINGLNTDVRHARVFVTGGQILVETDLPHDLELADLREAARRVADLARMLPPALRIRQQRLL